MNESDVVEILRAYISSQFPKSCVCCGKQYNSLAEYLRATKHVGKPQSYDAELDVWQPRQPLGSFSLANCSCGTTMSINSSDMGLLTMWKLMRWAKRETRSRGIEIADLLNELREKIDKAALDDEVGS